VLESNTLYYSKAKTEGGEKVKKEYESLQKEIDKLLHETSEEKTHKTYQEMRNDAHYKHKMKKIGKLTMELEQLEEKNRKNEN
jgi:hypothetical protein